jgi:nickel-dependent lactate racemase
MGISIPYGKERLNLVLPDKTIVYDSSFPERDETTEEIVEKSLSNLIGSQDFESIVRNRRKGKIVVVVSDITRPIPYYEFLYSLLKRLEDHRIEKNDIIILIATGMHRSSTPEERLEMFGEEIVRNYEIIDHRADDENELKKIEGKSWSGNEIRLNRHYVDSGLRIITGLVEPHFMAGFSGGRKAICPGLSSLDTIQKFHGYEFLSDPAASNVILDDNPCHKESFSVASKVQPDLTINVVLNNRKKVIAAYSGDLNLSHRLAFQFVKEHSCRKVEKQVDMIITSCGGYPLDSTFYQCIKGIVSCLPAVKKGGKIIASGSCMEGVGSNEYASTMKKYATDWRQFIEDIKNPENFIKDQWQFQMHIRAIQKVGIEHIFFLTEGLNSDDLDELSVNGYNVTPGKINEYLNQIIAKECRQNMEVGIIPEGPYCVPY